MPRARLFWPVTVLLAIMAGAGLPLPPPAQAQTAAPAAPPSPPIDYQADNRTLTVHLNGMPLNQAIEALSSQTHIQFRPPPPAREFDSRPVTASFERMPIERAIKQLLGPSNTAMLYGPGQGSGQGAKPGLMEVRVLELGIIPVVATTTPADERPSQVLRLNPTELQARREEMQKRRDEKRARMGRGGGGRRGGSSTPQSPAQNSGQDSGGQSSGIGGNGSNSPNSGQPSGGGSKQNGGGK